MFIDVVIEVDDASHYAMLDSVFAHQSSVYSIIYVIYCGQYLQLHLSD